MTTWAGWISDEGVWVVPGHDAHLLPESAAVLAVVDDLGMRIGSGEAPRLHMAVVGGDDPVMAWAGQPHQGEQLVADWLYKVLWPAPYGSGFDVAPMPGREARLGSLEPAMAATN